MTDFTVREALGLIGLAATILAAIANILALEATRGRRALLVVFLLTSLLLVLYVSRAHLWRQQVAVEQARQELEENVANQRSALLEAQRRIDREQASYDRAVNDALARMRQDFEQKLQEQARDLMARSQAPNKAYDEARQLMETRESLRRQDIRKFLVGMWQPSGEPKVFLFRREDKCDVTFTGDTIYIEDFLFGQYQISEVQGSEVVLRVLSREIVVQGPSPQIETMIPVSLNIKEDSISYYGEKCIRKP